MVKTGNLLMKNQEGGFDLTLWITNQQENEDE